MKLSPTVTFNFTLKWSGCVLKLVGLYIYPLELNT